MSVVACTCFYWFYASAAGRHFRAACLNTNSGFQIRLKSSSKSSYFWTSSGQHLSSRWSSSTISISLWSWYSYCPSKKQAILHWSSYFKFYFLRSSSPYFSSIFSIFVFKSIPRSCEEVYWYLPGSRPWMRRWMLWFLAELGSFGFDTRCSCCGMSLGLYYNVSPRWISGSV